MEPFQPSFDEGSGSRFVVLEKDKLRSPFIKEKLKEAFTISFNPSSVIIPGTCIMLKQRKYKFHGI